MIIITSNILSENVVEVDVGGRETSPEEIMLAYEALAQVVDGLCENDKKGEMQNGQ